MLLSYQNVKAIKVLHVILPLSVAFDSNKPPDKLSERVLYVFELLTLIIAGWPYKKQAQRQVFFTGNWTGLKTGKIDKDFWIDNEKMNLE